MITFAAVPCNSITAQPDVHIRGLLHTSSHGMNKWIIILALGFLSNGLAAQFVAESRLASGEWYKVCVDQSGVYRIDASMLSQMGVDASSISPSSVHVFGQRGGMLPERISDSRVDDLSQLSVMLSDDGNGSFSGSDAVLFWAQGPNEESYDTSSKRFLHQINYYSETNCYFVKIDPDLSSKAVVESASMPTGEQTISTFDDFVWIEEEEYNILKSGRDWFGARYGVENIDEVLFPLSNIVANTPVEIKIAVMSKSHDGPTSFAFHANDIPLGDVSIKPVSTYTYADKGIKEEETYVLTNLSTGENEDLKIDIEYTRNGNSSFGYLDYIEVTAQRELMYKTGLQRFRSLASIQKPTAHYQVSTTESDLIIWDVSDPLAISAPNLSFGSGVTSFNATSEYVREYVAFSSEDAVKPTFDKKVNNQNLHGISTSPNLLIITTEELKAEAERLAEFRESFDGLTAEVVGIQEIYNEFSSGKQDLVAIRDFLRMLHLRSNDGDGLKYVLLFGEASYDYKDRESSNTNLIPVYESNESLHPIGSYSSDDYIALLDENEGRWGTYDADDMEVGVGRIPVLDIDEAKQVVDKLIYYSQSPNCLGGWRDQLVFVADDGDSNLHQTQADELCEFVDTAYSDYLIAKLYVDAYPQVSLDAQTKKSPQLRQSLNDHVQNGSLIVNFTGHGAESGWTSEGVLDINLIDGWDNMDNMPLMMTATCEFGRYDDPGRRSGGEYSILHPKGGAIGLLTTTRPVWASNNFIVNQVFYKAIFRRMPSGEMPRLGDIIRETKNNSILADGNRNFALLGDPSMRLAYPKADIELTTISTDESGQTDTLKALNKVTVEGQVTENGELIADFNGTVFATIYDKRTTTTTYGDENPVMQFQERKQIIFKGQAVVENGKFSFDFVMPKDINYQFGSGRMSLYAMPEEGLTDAIGHYNGLVIGGSATAFVEDATPPLIELYLEDESFIDGDIVSPAPKLIVKLYDESGINTTGTGLGHDLKAEFSTDRRDELILNQFYETAPNDFRNGQATYQFALENKFEPGLHTIQVTAWDIHNNPAQAEVSFRVLDEHEVLIQDPIFYPNPTSGSGFIRFCHNKADEDLNVDLEIFDIQGRRVISRNYVLDQPDRCSELGITLGADLRPGMYFYQLRVSTSGSPAVASGKLVIAR